MKVSAVQWLVAIAVIGLVLAFGGRSVYRWFRPGNQPRPSGLRVVVIALLLAWVVGVLLVLAWKVIEASDRAARPAPVSLLVLPPNPRLQRTGMRLPLSRKPSGG
jgi:predicted PurR-regulated permease PerM